MVTVVMQSDSGYQTANEMPEREVNAFVDSFGEGWTLAEVYDPSDSGELFGDGCQ